MTDATKSKAGQAHVYGTPLIAVVLAVLGYLGNRDDNQATKAKATSVGRQAQVAQVEARAFSEERLRNAYISMQDAIKAQDRRIGDLESWVIELEEFVEDQTEADSPRNQREKEARDQRLVEIRAAKNSRARKSDEPAQAMLDYEDL